MKTVAILLCLLCLAVPSQAQKVSAMPEILEIATNDLIMITTPGVNNYKTTLRTLALNINPYLTVAATVTNAVATGSNLAVTNANTFGLFYRVGNLTNMEFFSLKTGTNIVLTRDGSNIVVNLKPNQTYSAGVNDLVVGTWGNLFGVSNAVTARLSLYNIDPGAGDDWTVAGMISATRGNFSSLVGSGDYVAISPGGTLLRTNAGSGDVTMAQLNTTSNTLASRIVANDNITSNALLSAMSSSTQMVVAAFGNATVTNTITANTLSVVNFNANTMTLTNAMGSNEVRLGYQQLTNILRRATIYADAAAMISNSTGGATFSTEETSAPTNRMYDSYIFSGAVTNLVQFKLTMPLNWDLSTVKVKLWTSGTNNIATTTNVWGISAASVKHLNVITNIDWGSELTITNVVSSLGGAALLTPPTPALTIGNSPAAAGNLVWFRIRRLPGHPDDSDGGQQKLLGAWVQYSETMSEVASW